MAKPWFERPVSEANKSGKQGVLRWEGSSVRKFSLADESVRRFSLADESVRRFSLADEEF